jgi:hypothetical protein
MLSRRNGEYRRSVLAALAAMVAAVLPSLVSSRALAEKATEKAAPAAASSGKKVTKTAQRAGTKGKKTAKKTDAAEAPRRRCKGATIAIDRVGLEEQSLSLLDCREEPIASAQAALSILARPWGAPKPAHLALHAATTKAAAGHLGEVAPGVRLLHRGLLARVDAIAHRFPGRRISLVSGYRPQSRGSQHQSGRALDLRVLGVGNEELVAFCKTLADTGCGYYPNSSFVHVDVRAPGTGGVSWIDTSGPGEAPRYVHQWPPPPEDTEPHDGSADPWMVDPADP